MTRINSVKWCVFFSSILAFIVYLTTYTSVHAVSEPISIPVTFIEGDINQNGTVDIFDFNTLVTDFGKTGLGLVADFNHNGRVDIYDFNTLVTNFGKHL